MEEAAAQSIPDQYKGTAGLALFLRNNNLLNLTTALAAEGYDTIADIAELVGTKEQLQQELCSHHGVKNAHVARLFVRINSMFGNEQASILNNSVMNNSIMNNSIRNSSILQKQAIPPSFGQLDGTMNVDVETTANIASLVDQHSFNKGLKSVACSSRNGDGAVSTPFSCSPEPKTSSTGSRTEMFDDIIPSDKHTTSESIVDIESNTFDCSALLEQQNFHKGLSVPHNSSAAVSTNDALCSGPSTSTNQQPCSSGASYSPLDRNTLREADDRHQEEIRHPAETDKQGAPLGTHVSVSTNDTSGGSDLQYLIAGMALDIFGIANLRPFQADAIKAVAEGKHAVIVQATGSGKSLIFQLLPFVTKKPVIVVVPTRALMLDHVQYLNKKGVPCAMLGCGQTLAQNQEVEEKLRLKDYKIVFVTPEYMCIRDGRFMEEIVHPMSRNNDLSAIAVDEVHCAVKWANFRSSYLQLDNIKNLDNTPVVLLTATVREEHLQILINRLLSPEREIYKKISSINRPNISFSVRYVDKSLAPTHLSVLKNGGSEQYWRPLVDEIVDETDGSKCIVYIDNKAVCRQITACFQARGVSAQYIIGSDEQTVIQKVKIINDWTNGDVQVIVATTAFGLGVNVRDIRHVYRLGYTDSIEELVQEFGRAGRDGEPARGTMIVYPGDRMSSATLFLKSCNNRMEQNSVSTSLNVVCAYGASSTCYRQFLLKAFNDENSGTCIDRNEEPCDHCSNRNRILRPVTEEVAVFLKAVDECNKLGVNKTVLYVTGSKNVKMANIHKGTAYGAGVKFLRSADWWKRLADKVIGLQLLKQGFYPDVLNPNKCVSLRANRNMTDWTRPIIFFCSVGREYGSFSNFFECLIKFDNFEYPTLEHCYQTIKLKFFGFYREADAMMMRNLTPMQFKNETYQVLGQVSALDMKKWSSSINQEVMRALLYQKFRQHPNLGHELMSTGNQLLVECTLDPIWGNGVTWSRRHKDPCRGRNLCGKLLMDVRDLLNGSQLLASTLVVGDSMVRGLLLANGDVVSLSGALATEVFLVARVLSNIPYTRIIVHCGTNNIGKRPDPPGPNAHRTKLAHLGTNGKLIANKIVKQAQFLSSQCQQYIYVSGVIKRMCDVGEIRKERNEENCNAQLRNRLNPLGIMYIDHEGVFVPDDYNPDNLHLNGTGLGKLSASFFFV